MKQTAKPRKRQTPMLDQRRVAAQADENREQSFREQLFTERYEALHAWALRLTNQHSDSADDLVQDAFVQWVLSRTRLEEIENIDGYLRNMLRNMYLSRMSRSAHRLHETALSIADYDSGRLGWATIESPRRMQASQELYQICVYACSRKESSKAGSVLLLRFFHNYFPTEIASVLKSSRNCVDQWQRLARREAKLFMARPGGLRFLNARVPTGHQQVRYSRLNCDLMLDLRRFIFSSCHDDCLSKQGLHDLYARGQDEALSTANLAHIVSCPKCLDAINGLLNLPRLSERYSSDSSGPKEPPSDGAGGGASGGGFTELTKKFAYRLSETREHKPQELRIAVNGLLLSTLKVNSELTDLHLNLTPNDLIEFVEVSSEQGIQLLFFSISATRPQYEQWARIELSEGRALELSFQNKSEPSLHVVYKDPTADETYMTGEIPKAKVLASPLDDTPKVTLSSERNVGSDRALFDLRASVKRLVTTLRAIKRASIVEEKIRQKSQALLSSLRQMPPDIREFPFLNSIDELSDYGQSRRQLGFVVLVSLAVLAGLLFFKASLSRELNATILIERATAAEQAYQTSTYRVSHRFIKLEERRSERGEIVSLRKIESWQNSAKGDIARRLYDDSNRLIAATLEKSHGPRTVFHHGLKSRTETALASPDNLLLNLDDIWQLEPSANVFGSFITEPNVTGLEERSTTYVLRYEKGRTIGASHLLKATLTLRKSDLHPIEQMLLVQRGSELHEYRFVETSFELVPIKAVAPTVFEIEPELTEGTRETGNGTFRDLKSSRVPSSLNTSNSPIASAELEVDVSYLLNRAKADRNEQVALTRSARGSLRVEGVVDTQQRKDEFLRALGPVSNNPAVKIEIRTIEEAKQRVVSAAPVAIQQSEGIKATVAADEELRAYFSRNDPGGSTDEAIRSYSSRMVNRGYRALFHAIELKRLVDRFTNVDMHTLAPDARAKWVAMLREHVSGFARENAVLRQEIGPVFFPAASANVAEEDLIQTDADLARAVERLHKLALANNDAIRSAFTISAQSSAAALKSAAFWQSLQRAEKLAERIRQYQTASN